MSRLSVSRRSFCEFGECEMISDVKLMLPSLGAVSKNKSGAGRYGDGSGRDRE